MNSVFFTFTQCPNVLDLGYQESCDPFFDIKINLEILIRQQLKLKLKQKEQKNSLGFRIDVNLSKFILIQYLSAIEGVVIPLNTICHEGM